MPPYEQLRLEHQLCFALHRASRALVRAYAPLLEASGLTYTQYVVMLVLWESHPDELAVGELGQRLQLETGTLTPLLKRLEGAGLVARRRDPADERRVLVAATPEGLALRRTLAGVPARIFAATGLEGEAALGLKQQLEALAVTLDAASGA